MTEDAAQVLGVQLIRVEVRGRDDLESAFASISTRQPDALFVERHALFGPLRTAILAFAAQQRVPTMWGTPADVAAGGLMAYGVSYPASFRRAAGYVAKILKGTKPADLPVERPTTSEFVLNLRTAQQLGLALPRSVLEQSTVVIQ